ncbi:hypothetical protein ABVK25_002857 [Lepraria finkii]|uniref:Uncharacterized protein n=1 Tax=Lepraria finkii TaxID=1340010 RepID=A0ABR4BH14_9LECA
MLRRDYRPRRYCYNIYSSPLHSSNKDKDNLLYERDMGGTNVTDFASIWEWEENREWNELSPAIGLDLLACFCSLQVFFGRSMEQTEWAKWFALIWARQHVCAKIPQLLF